METPDKEIQLTTEARKSKLARVVPIDSKYSNNLGNSLIRLGRAIRNGHYGEVTVGVVIYRTKDPEGNKLTNTYWAGQGTFEEAIFAIEMAKKKLLG